MTKEDFTERKSETRDVLGLIVVVLVPNPLSASTDG